MILEEFDSSQEAILNPNMFHKKIEGIPSTCIAFFSLDIMDTIKENFKLEKVSQIFGETTKTPIYKTTFNNTHFAITHAPVGAPACVEFFEELIAMGIKNLLLVGSCGCLVPEMQDYSIIIPTSAIRDEGTSYHYLPANDEISLDEKIIETIESVIKNCNIKYYKGKTWTCDALFRETKEKTQRRINQGAIAVEMECSAMVAVSKFRKVNFGQILYGADNLSKEKYEARNFVYTNKDSVSKIIPIALEVAYAINEKF